MPELLKTTEDGAGKKAHSHVAYVREQDGETSMNKGHNHAIIMRVVSPNAISQGGMNYWEVQPADDGHSHEVGEYPVKDLSAITQTDSELVTEVTNDWVEDKEREKDSRASGVESEDMYAHKQWEDGKVAELQGKDRAALTINRLEEKIDNLSGYQRQNRTDIKYLPTENGDSRVADILNIVVKNITEQCYFPREETKVFDDAAIAGRGLFNIYEDFDKDIFGQIIIEKYKWDECNFGPHEKEDLSDCDRIEKTKWYSIAKLKELYPEHADDFLPENKMRDSGSNLRSEDWDKRLGEADLYNTNKYRLLEQWRKIFRRTYILANAQENFVYNADGWTEADVNSVKTIPGFVKIPRVTYRMQVAVVSAGKLLDKYHVDDEEDFPIVPLYAKYRNNEFWGKIESVKDLQKLINKAYSQFIDIIGKTANYGWFFEEQTFPDKNEEARFRANASSPGFTQKISDISRPPQKVEGVKFPTELSGAIAMFSGDMREIMNINLEMLGQGGASESGIAIKQKITQQLLGNDFLFDNLSFAKKKIGQMIVKKIQKLYSPDRLMRILSNENKQKPVEIGGQPLDSYQPEDIRALLETADLTQYDVIVSESSASPSTMLSNFLLMMELAGKGVQIPPQAILEYAPIPNKEKVMQMLEQQQKQQQESEDKKYQTEIAKTMIAKGDAGGGGAPGPGGAGPI